MNVVLLWLMVLAPFAFPFVLYGLEHANILPIGTTRWIIGSLMIVLGVAFACGLIYLYAAFGETPSHTRGSGFQILGRNDPFAFHLLAWFLSALIIAGLVGGGWQAIRTKPSPPPKPPWIGSVAFHHWLKQQEEKRNREDEATNWIAIVLLVLFLAALASGLKGLPSN